MPDLELLGRERWGALRTPRRSEMYIMSIRIRRHTLVKYLQGAKSTAASVECRKGQAGPA